MGEVHLKAHLDSPHTRHVYIVEPDDARANALQREYQVRRTSLEELLGNTSIRFVSIASPNEFHLQQAEACMKNGKAVLLEKPMGTTLEEARCLVEVEKETKSFLQVGFELHYSKLYQMAKEWIDAGAIGEPVNIQTRYFCCEFHRRNNWRSNSTGSFLIGEKLSHYLDLQRFFFNERFESIYSMSSKKVVPYFNHRDNHQIMTKYPNGKIAVLNFIMYLAETDYDELSKDPLVDLMSKQADDGCVLSYLICGTKGAIETDVFRRRIRRWEFGEREDGMTSKIVETFNFPPEEDQIYFHNVYGEVLHVIGLIANGKQSEMNANDAFETMKMCFAAEMSENLCIPINSELNGGQL